MAHIPLLSIFRPVVFASTRVTIFQFYNQGGKKNENHFPQTEITNLIKAAMRMKVNQDPITQPQKISIHEQPTTKGICYFHDY